MNINVAILGHVDHGKSTLIGRLLYDSQVIPEDKLTELDILLQEYKKRFEFAYFLDSFEEELREERTIDTTRVLFKGRNYYTIVDVPGHKEFIKNMLTGASHTQAGILVVSVLDGVREQTRRHAFLLHMLGIRKIFVAINKMDLVDYHKEAFQSVKKEINCLLSSFGYVGVKFIPISAIAGDNIYKASRRMDWYQGPTLIQALDEIELEEISEKTLRFIVQDIYFIDSKKVTVGRIELGALREKDELIFQPSGMKGSVERIKFFPEEVKEAKAGDSIGIVIDCEVKRGEVAGNTLNPPIAIGSFLGEVVLLEGTLKQGDDLEMKCGTKRAKCLVKEIKERISSETGEVIEEDAEKVMKNEAAVIMFKTEPLVVEKFSEIPELGRFVLSRGRKNIGAGIVLEREK